VKHTGQESGSVCKLLQLLGDFVFTALNPLQCRGVTWLHFAIQV